MKKIRDNWISISFVFFSALVFYIFHYLTLINEHTASALLANIDTDIQCVGSIYQTSSGEYKEAPTAEYFTSCAGYLE